MMLMLSNRSSALNIWKVISRLLETTRLNVKLAWYGLLLAGLPIDRSMNRLPNLAQEQQVLKNK
jgi:hypothetical protein